MKERQVSCDITESKKMIQINLFTKWKQMHKENKLMVARGGGMETGIASLGLTDTHDCA